MVSGTPEQLRFVEHSVGASLQQLIGDFWSVGGRYRLSRGEFQDRFPMIPEAASADFVSNFRYFALLHQVDTFVRFHHPSGVFAIAEATWFDQSLSRMAGDQFWQLNLMGGYRFPRRRAEVRVGVMNVTGQDYRLDPLSSSRFIPRERVVTVGLRFNL